MLTIKLITEQTERVIKGLEKKHFGNAVETINQVIELDKKRRAAQTALDKNLAEAKQLAARIGALMKEGKREEAEEIKAQVSAQAEELAALQVKEGELQAKLNEVMWTELFMDNADNLVSELDGLIASLKEYRNAIESGDAATLQELLAEGRRCKEEVDG